MQITVKLDQNQLEELQNLADAIRLLTKTIQGQKATETLPSEVKTAAKPKAKKEQSATQADSESVTYEMITKAGPAFIMANGKDVFVELLKKYGAGKSPKELKEEDYAAFYKDITDGAQ